MNYKMKVVLMLLLLSLGWSTASAVPAYPKAKKVIQPDGTCIMLQGHGNEFGHYLTTEDGTVVRKGDDGFYRPTGEDARKMLRARTSDNSGLKRLAPKRVNVTDRPYRGLVLLVNFTDRKFSRGDQTANNFYNKLMNKEGFTADFDKYYATQRYTGSVRDYFSDNSYGKFVPSFDVIGPIDIDVSQYYIDGVKNTYPLMEKVLAKADETVDYTRYDVDGDGVMDMVYVIYAGYSSHYQDNDERLIWPHAGNMNDREDGGEPVVHDGVTMGRFACSAEIYGWHSDGDKMLDGIGVIVHEFSHVLGFMDHYDTSNGYQEHPNAWDIMSAGCYSDDYNRTPCGFNSYEKYAAGFIQPMNITQMGGQKISLDATEKAEDACLLHSYQETVCFLMENRQAVKWDKNLPGHGLCVWRVDSTNVDYWIHNALNVTTRACFRLVRADGTQGSFFTGVVDTDYDSFPGTHNVTDLDNDDLDNANLISYDQYPCPVVLRNIAETNGIITFDVEEDVDAQNKPLTTSLPKRFYAKAEKLVGNDWVPVTWTVKTKTVGEKNYIYDLVPNDVCVSSTERDYSEGVFIEYSFSGSDEHLLNVVAQRVAVGEDYSTWICDFNNTEQQGSGAMQLKTNRYGLPQFVDSNARVGYCLMKPKAYLVTEKGMLERLSTYRNIVFAETAFPEETGIDVIVEEADAVSTFRGGVYDMKGRKICVDWNDAEHDSNGPSVSGLLKKGIYIINGRKVLIK